jgi:hypothetical protein
MLTDQPQLFQGGEQGAGKDRGRRSVVRVQGAREAFQKKAVERKKMYYFWEDVMNKYERLFRQVINNS